MKSVVQAWCPTCGIVRDAEEPLPYCRHNQGAKPGPPPTKMELLPKRHPHYRGK